MQSIKVVFQSQKCGENVKSNNSITPTQKVWLFPCSLQRNKRASLYKIMLLFLHGSGKAGRQPALYSTGMPTPHYNGKSILSQLYLNWMEFKPSQCSESYIATTVSLSNDKSYKDFRAGRVKAAYKNIFIKCKINNYSFENNET